MRNRFLIAVLPLLWCAACTGSSDGHAAIRGDDVESESDESEYEVAAYYYPGYHRDVLNEWAIGTGWTEWDVVYNATPRFDGHRQPRVPLWGYADESHPQVMEQKIDAAADHGLTSFIFDWYWYENGPFLNGALERGFLNATNRDRLRFGIMWVNQNWHNVFPAPLRGEPPLLFSGAVTAEQFEQITDYLLWYFVQPEYWLIDGRPYFSMYDILYFVESLGGYDEARDALARFRQKVKDAGFPDLYLVGITTNWLDRVTPEDIAWLGFDAVTHYTWIHHVGMPTFPVTDYAGMVNGAAGDWQYFGSRFSIPYFPNVTVAWDSSPRTDPSAPFEQWHYPYMPVAESTPWEFKRALQLAKGYMDARDVRKILVINAWNEWSEAAYLEPDTDYGWQYLDALDQVFGDAPDPDFVGAGNVQ